MGTKIKENEGNTSNFKKRIVKSKKIEKQETYTVLIQENLLSDLEDLLFKQHIEIKLHKDYLVYFLSLFISLPTAYRNNEESDADSSEVSLCSQKLKKVIYNYTDYISFLEQSKFIEKIKNYSTDRKQCSKYRLADMYALGEIVSYEISDKQLIKKISKIELNEKTLYCIRNRPHLIKFFDDNLKIDSTQAFEIVKQYKETSPAKYCSGLHIITEFHYKKWKYTIKQETDFRLHSSFTRLNKELRKTITYKSEKLGAIDIRASQPFFLAVILKAILKKDRELLKKIGATRVLSDEAIDYIFELEFDKGNVIDFVNIVLSEDFYSSFQKCLVIKYDEDGKPFRMITNYQNKKTKEINYQLPKVKKVFDSERDYAKSIVMEVLFCSPNNHFEGVKAFKNAFPSVYEIMLFIKKNCVALDTLLTNVEAHCFLDVVALEFSKKFPHVPIWSIHDCLVTTQSHVGLLHQQVESMLLEVTTIKKKNNQPLTVIEYW